MLVIFIIYNRFVMKLISIDIFDVCLNFFLYMLIFKIYYFIKCCDMKVFEFKICFYFIRNDIIKSLYYNCVD